jgi:hypothetical protein
MVLSVAFSPDNRRVISGSADRTLKVWDAETGALIRTLTGHNNMVWSVAFSPDSRYIISGSNNNDIKIWEAESGRLIRTITGLLGYASSLSYTPDGQRIMAGAMDGTVRLYNVEDGAEVAQFVGFLDKEWVAITPDGFYSASPKGDGRISVLTNSTVYGIDSYRATFYKPPVVAARLSGEESRASLVSTSILDAASFEPPVVIIRGPSGGAAFSSPHAELSVSVADQRQPVKTVKVLVNGRLLGSDDMRGLNGSRGLVVEHAGGLSVTGTENRVDFRFPITLTPGSNRIEVIATNGYSEGRDIVEVTYRGSSNEQEILPNLWILAIGVNSYDDTTIRNLDYSVADARGIIDAFKVQEGKVYRKVNSLLIADGSALPPTAENIKDNLSYLSQAGQRDVVLLFIAGHGVNDVNGNFLFLPSDASFDASGNIRPSRAVSNREIYSVLDVPGQKLVFIDSCHSEGVSGRRTTRAVDNNQ